MTDEHGEAVIAAALAPIVFVQRELDLVAVAPVDFLSSTPFISSCIASQKPLGGGGGGELHSAPGVAVDVGAPWGVELTSATRKRQGSTQT
jgi:hypothetical protein